MKKRARKKEALHALASRMFESIGKEPYYLGDAKTASRMRKRSEGVGRIISAKCSELEKYWEK